MNFSINRDILLENLNLIQRGLPVKTAMPVLNGIKLELTKEDLFLTSSNNDISIKVVINDSSLEIKEPGNIIVPGNFFIQIIKKINSKTINIYLIEDKIVVIKAERSEFKLNLYSYYDYPNIDFVSLDNSLVLPSRTIKSIIKETAYAASTSEKRPILTGVSLKLSGNTLTAVATDSFRLSQKKVEIENNTFDDFNIVVPFKAFDELSKSLDNYNDQVEMFFDKSKVLFKFKNILFQSRLLEGNYPDTSRLIPNEFQIKVKFNKEELQNAIDRVSLLSTKDVNSSFTVVRFTINNNQTIDIQSSRSEIGDANEQIIPIEPIVGPELKIAFSSKFILDALKSFISPEIELLFTGEIRPFIIRGDLDEDLTALILPVRVEW